MTETLELKSSSSVGRKREVGRLKTGKEAWFLGDRGMVLAFIRGLEVGVE